MKIKCDVCQKLLKEPGGLLFSPPSQVQSRVYKYHLCKACYAGTLLGIWKHMKTKGYGIEQDYESWRQRIL